MQVLTYIPEFNVVLSRRCANACGYCNFPNTTSPQLPSIKTIKRYTRTADRLGAVQMTLTAGEGIEDIPEVYNTARYYGFAGYYEYLNAVCRTILSTRTRMPVFPVLEVGKIPLPDLRRLSGFVPAVRLLLAGFESVPTKPNGKFSVRNHVTAERLAALHELGRQGIPVVTGLLVGIGESSDERRRLAQQVASINRKFGHIQRFAIRPFRPLPFSPFADMTPARDELVLEAIRDISEEAGDSLTISAELQEKLHLISPAAKLGIRDIGPVRLGNSEQINVDASAMLDEQKEQLRAQGIRLCVRLPFEEQTGSIRNSPIIQQAVQRFVTGPGNADSHMAASADCA